MRTNLPKFAGCPFCQESQECQETSGIGQNVRKLSGEIMFFRKMSGLSGIWRFLSPMTSDTIHNKNEVRNGCFFCPSVQRLQVTDLEINEGKMSGNLAKMCQENVRNVRNLAPSRRVDTLPLPPQGCSRLRCTRLKCNPISHMPPIPTKG